APAGRGEPRLHRLHRVGAAGDALEPVADLGAFLGADQVEEGPAARRLVAEPGEAAEGGVELVDAARRIEPRDRDRRLLEQAAETLLGALERGGHLAL